MLVPHLYLLNLGHGDIEEERVWCLAACFAKKKVLVQNCLSDSSEIVEKCIVGHDQTSQSRWSPKPI